MTPENSEAPKKGFAVEVPLPGDIHVRTLVKEILEIDANGNDEQRKYLQAMSSYEAQLQNYFKKIDHNSSSDRKSFLLIGIGVCTLLLTIHQCFVYLDAFQKNMINADIVIKLLAGIGSLAACYYSFQYLGNNFYDSHPNREESKAIEEMNGYAELLNLTLVKYHPEENLYRALRIVREAKEKHTAFLDQVAKQEEDQRQQDLAEERYRQERAQRKKDRQNFLNVLAEKALSQPDPDSPFTDDNKASTPQNEKITKRLR